METASGSYSVSAVRLLAFEFPKVLVRGDNTTPCQMVSSLCPHQWRWSLLLMGAWIDVPCEDVPCEFVDAIKLPELAQIAISNTAVDTVPRIF